MVPIVSSFGFMCTLGSILFDFILAGLMIVIVVCRRVVVLSWLLL